MRNLWWKKTDRRWISARGSHVVCSAENTETISVIIKISEERQLMLKRWVEVMSNSYEYVFNIVYDDEFKKTVNEIISQRKLKVTTSLALVLYIWSYLH